MCGGGASDILGTVQLRCLIVDDNPNVLVAARGLLEREGLSVVGVASNTADAVRSIAELQPDVALVDIDLGGESGFELARQLDGTRVILISTHAERDYADLIEASPAIGFLAKSDLSASAIREILNAPRET
jgi:DNA-binding NarL/FixJ family response regulator